MIFVNRPPAPEYLRSERLVYAKEELRRRFYSNSQERLKFDMGLMRPIVDDLARAFGYKCAYCESKLGVTSSVEIDSFRPKGGSKSMGGEFSKLHYWWLAYEWNNLYPCCETCNKYKANFFPIEEGTERASIDAPWDEVYREQSLLIDPCMDEPDDHLTFNEKGVVGGKTKKGQITIELLGLNRPQLVNTRSEVAEQLISQLAAFSSHSYEQYEQHFEKILSDISDMPYLGMQRQILKSWLEFNFIHLSKGVLAIEKKATELTEEALQLDYTSGKAAIISQGIRGFTIKSIEIKNFRTITDLKLNVLPSDSLSERESWLLLLGDNGVGKSSILQAIALTLAGKNKIEELGIAPGDYFRRRKTEGAASKQDEDDGYVKIYIYEQADPITLHFDEKEFRGNDFNQPTFLLGYGSTRLLPKGDLRPTNTDGYVNIDNLFDYSVALTGVNEWLSKVSPVEFEDRIAPALFDLLDMEQGDTIAFSQGELRINGDFGIDKISDGYKSIIGLACDIMKTLSSDSAGYHTVSGVVLIDELGNHLHPRWRMKIVTSLRKAFPKLQFIVSTHEPLCLRGLLHGEVVVLVEDEHHEIRALDKSLLPDHNLLRVDQLLTSDLFGLINTLDFETQRKYEDYYKLLSKPQEERSPKEKTQIEEYTKELAEKEHIGSNPQLQVFYEIINEKFAKNLADEGFKTKDELKQETIAEVKDLIDSKKLDWL